MASALKKDASGPLTEFSELRKDKQQQLRELYEQLDVNKDGRIDVKDLATALRKRAPIVASDTSKYAQEIMDRADVNSGNGIDFNEFVTYVLDHERKLELTFRDLDRNKDGYIDHEEIKRHLEELGLTNVTTSRTKALISKMTRDGAHSISWEEFQRYFFLHPGISSQDIRQHWRSLFIDVGDDGIVVPEVSDSHSWLKHLASGGIAGAVSRTSTAPLDRLKIFLQVYASRQNKFGLITSFRLLLKEGGMRGLWRGNGTNVLKIIPESAIKFWSYEQAKVFIANANQSGQLSLAERFAAGSIAGAISQTSVYPLEVLKTRLALRKTGEMNRGLMNAFLEVYRNEGLRAFGRGYLPNLIGIIPYAGTELAVYETLKNLVINTYFSNRDPPLGIILGCGVASCTVAQLVSYPLGLVRTRLQAHASNQPVTMLGQFSLILKQEGVPGLYRGLVPNFMKVLPSVGISYMTYEAVRKSLGVHMR